MIADCYYVTTTISGSVTKENLISAYTAEAAQCKAVRIRAMECGIPIESVTVTACRPKAEPAASRTMSDGDWWRLVVSIIDVGAMMRHVHRSTSDTTR